MIVKRKCIVGGIIICVVIVTIVIVVSFRIFLKQAVDIRIRLYTAVITRSIKQISQALVCPGRKLRIAIRQPVLDDSRIWNVLGIVIDRPAIDISTAPAKEFQVMVPVYCVVIRTRCRISPCIKDSGLCRIALVDVIVMYLLLSTEDQTFLSALLAHDRNNTLLLIDRRIYVLC